jgi:FMNH2-dependent dimethyl sulfone monooxygenase
MADEFITIVQRLWAAEDNLTVEGRYWRMEEAFVGIKPRYGRPISVSASGSQAGVEYAAKHSDIIFTTSPGGARIENALARSPPIVQLYDAPLKKEDAPSGRSLIQLSSAVRLNAKQDSIAIRSSKQRTAP